VLWFHARGNVLAAATLMNPSSKHDRTEERRRQADGSVLFVGPNLRVRVAVLKPGVVLASTHGEVIGSQDADVEAAVLGELDRELESAGTLALFADLRQSPRLPAISREKLAQWASRHKGRLLTCHVLVQSQLLEMAMSLVTLVVGGDVLETHTRPQAFLAMVKKESPTLTKLPSVPER
jgi:hypothetical protein